MSPMIPTARMMMAITISTTVKPRRDRARARRRPMSAAPLDPDDTAPNAHRVDELRRPRHHITRIGAGTDAKSARVEANRVGRAAGGGNGDVKGAFEIHRFDEIGARGHVAYANAVA